MQWEISARSWWAMKWTVCIQNTKNFVQLQNELMVFFTFLPLHLGCMNIDVIWIENRIYQSSFIHTAVAHLNYVCAKKQVGRSIYFLMRWLYKLYVVPSPISLVKVFVSSYTLSGILHRSNKSYSTNRIIKNFP